MCHLMWQVAHLQALGDALPGTLELWDADLLQEGAFDEVIMCVQQHSAICHCLCIRI